MKKFLVVVMLAVMCVPCNAAEGVKFAAVCDNGTFNGVLSSDNVITWLGVPYAKPPVGSLRWKAPQAPEASTAAFEADRFSAMPIQKVRDTNPSSLMPQDEDCLYLNVWKASDDNVAPRPVMVWVHGGSFRANGTAEPEWHGHKLAADNPEIMVVSVGYRLGLMGFIDFSEVSGGENFAESGNLGILDVLQSLKWLKANIASFGGDPDNITVFGQSSGSALISLLMTIPEAQGLFQRAILQSGAVSMSMARKSAAEDATELARKLLKLTGKTDMAGLMALTSKDLQNAANKLEGALNFPERDGVVLSEDVYAAFAANAGNYDILIGSNADEARYFLGAIGSVDLFGDYVTSAYVQLTDAMSKIPDYGEAMVDAAENFIALQGNVEPVWAYTEFLNDLLFRVPAIQMASSPARTGRTYMYYWNIPTIAPYLACHAVEIPFIFDLPSPLIPADALNTAQVQGIRALVQSIWVDFAKDGVINGVTEYTASNRTTMVISPDTMPVSAVNDPLGAQRQLMTPLLALNFSGRDIINLVNSDGADEKADDTPTSPDVPVNPTSPDVPVIPTSPDVPVIPTSPDVPVIPTSPDVPFNPTSPDVPHNPTSPDSPSETHSNVTQPTVSVEEVIDTVRELLNLANVIVVELPASSSGTSRTVSDIPSSQLSAIEAQGREVAVVLPELTVTTAAINVFGVSLDNLAPGATIFLDMTRRSATASNASVSAAEDYAGEYVFLDDDGNEVYTVPPNRHVNIAAYLEPDYVYSPVITTSEATGVGSSSGGCSTGFSVAILLTGLALVMRKK